MLKQFTYCLLLSLTTMLMIGNNLQAQDKYELIGKVKTEATYLSTDFLKNAYLATSSNKLIKYDSTGQVIGVYGEKKYGPIHSIDARSPFNVLVFYQDYSTIVSLDMQLNKKKLYRLSNVGINNIAAMCLSDDSYLWVFDTDDQKLKKINNTYEEIYASYSMIDLLGEAITPSHITEDNGMVYLNVPNLGILIFDIFGTYYSSVTNMDLGVDNLQQFQVINGKIAYFNDGKLFVFDTAQGVPQAVTIPKTGKANQLRIERGRLYLLEDNELKIYAR